MQLLLTYDLHIERFHRETTTDVINQTHTGKGRRKCNSAILRCRVTKTTATIDLLITILQ